MRLAEKEKDYELIEATCGEKLERFGEIVLIRPDPQVIWHTPKTSPLWEKAHGHYHRSKTGGGSWEFHRKTPESWTVSLSGLTLSVKLTGFKHTGIFPEQAVNWQLCSDLIQREKRPLRVLNLFAYTGAATVACLKAGAEVCHVDAAKGMVQWARTNASLSDVSSRPCRWIVDDCEKFVLREIRRGAQYDAVIMDPPSYGRGPGGELWSLEDKLFPLLESAAQLLSSSPLFFLLNSYTTGFGSSVMKQMLEKTVAAGRKSTVESDEIGLSASTGGILPCGNSAVCRFH